MKSSSSINCKGQSHKDFLPSAPPLKCPSPEYGTSTHGYDAPASPLSYETLNYSKNGDTDSSSITKEEAKLMFLEFAKKKSYYGTKTANELLITKIRNVSVYHYTLKSLAEERSVSWMYEPLTDQSTSFHSCLPNPWNVQVPLPIGFIKHEKKVAIPGSQLVKTCFNCTGVGSLICIRCRGKGKITCFRCEGFGKRDSKKCSHCIGDGRKSCVRCWGTGKIVCKNCDGKKELLHYIELTVKWTPYEDHHIVNRTELPSKLIKKITGNVVYEEEKTMIQPLTEFWNAEVNFGSAVLFDKHLDEMALGQRIVRQNHCVRVIPVIEVHYMWKERINIFFIYGLEKEVYVARFSQRSSYCCSVL